MTVTSRQACMNIAKSGTAIEAEQKAKGMII